MHLSNSSVPVDPTLAALLLPGSPTATPAAAGGGDPAIAFEQLFSGLTAVAPTVAAGAAQPVLPSLADEPAEIGAERDDEEETLAWPVAAGDLPICVAPLVSPAPLARPERELNFDPSAESEVSSAAVMRIATAAPQSRTTEPFAGLEKETAPTIFSEPARPTAENMTTESREPVRARAVVPLKSAEREKTEPSTRPLFSTAANAFEVESEFMPGAGAWAGESALASQSSDDRAPAVQPPTIAVPITPHRAEDRVVWATHRPTQAEVAVVRAMPSPADAAATTSELPEITASLTPREQTLPSEPAREQLPDTGSREAARPIADARGENFADLHRENFTRDRGLLARAAKTFVSAPREPLTHEERGLGIGTAQRRPTMPSAVPSLHPVSEYAAGAVVSASVLEVSAPSPADPVAAVTTPQRAVEAVLEAVDRISDREQTSVRLQFSLGDAELDVRVELRADEVRTTFRTDSSELRATLSQEWHAVTSATPERSLRLAPPVFTSSDSGSFNSASGDASAGHRGQHQQAHAERSQLRPDFAPRPQGDRSAAAVTAPTVVARANSHHLHTLA